MKIKKQLFYRSIYLLIATELLVFGIFLKNQTKNSPVHKETAQKIASRSAALITPSPTPASSPKPVYFGFCQNVPILLYHHIQQEEQTKANGQQSLTVDDKIFDKQMNYLMSSGYQTLSVDQLIQSLIHKQRLPAKSIIITIDDGYADAYNNAYPVLYKYHLQANLMIPTGLIGNPGYMSWDELKRMVDGGLISAYDHTWSHANLATLSDENAKKEILTAKTQLEERLGKPVNIFAYPYGSENQRIVNLLRANGFVAALSTIPGFIQCDSFIMSLHRTRIGNAPLSRYGI